MTKNGRSKAAQERHEARQQAYLEKQRVTHPSALGHSAIAENNLRRVQMVIKGIHLDESGQAVER